MCWLLPNCPPPHNFHHCFLICWHSPVRRVLPSPNYLFVHFLYYHCGLRYLYFIQWVIICPCLYYQAHIGPTASVLKMTASGCWTGVEWSRVHLIDYYPRNTSFNAFSSFSRGQLSVHLPWPGQCPTIPAPLPLSSRMEGAPAHPVEARPGLRQTQVSSEGISEGCDSPGKLCYLRSVKGSLKAIACCACQGS